MNIIFVLSLLVLVINFINFLHSRRIWKDIEKRRWVDAVTMWNTSHPDDQIYFE